ncbi:NUDIX domain-containing protein [Kitasatospora sp. NPDC086801]|uniref:NUDIX domain-containing protein n=1 Tax=Kitasatospora sp. NPDC086801 TaxID=3364066 RepID=UPI0037F16324
MPTNLPATNSTGRNYLQQFTERTVRVYKTPDKPGSGVSRPALERLLKDDLVVLGEPDATEPGHPVLITDLGRAVLGAHLASTVPAELRSWSATWPEYRPVDMTPPELRPEALAQQVPGWAEAAATPADVRDWQQRQAAALVPFELDERGWPLHPLGRTGSTGRNLGKWGENSAADPIVVAGYGDQRRVLLITRSDIGVEAISGGMTDPGENAPQTLVRELREETGIDLADHHPVILGKDVVDDWRATDHAWVSSTSALFQLPAEVTAVAADDATDANWWPFGSLDQLDAAIGAAGRTLYAAHRPLLARALAHLDQQ